ncbi:putative coiled-coil protein SlyX [Acidovorax soli]|uniref:Putative coiled-coil protein SlyX n=1 Tax=Acidovorax soli TaxID=592050 RepID=A0A7X0PK69_9BURK|nr:type III secretion system translocon subunit SctB [Acidovorax soli]MBB6562911.1 putative coiled-coil protein SlyX [Acidovorax soli]
MSIDGINRGGAANFYGVGDAGQAGGPSGAQGAGTNQQTDLTALLNASKLLGDNRSNPADGLKQPDGGSITGAMSVLGSLGDNQVSADIYAFMALFQQMAQQMRDTARTQRTTEMQAQVTSLQNAAEQMKTAAAERFSAAIAQGAMQIAGGLMQAGMSAISVNNTVKGAQMQNQADGMSPKAVQLTGIKVDAAKLTATGQAQMNYGQAMSGISAGMGGMIGASFTLAADKADAAKMQLETQAKVQETAVQHANDMMQQMMDVIRDVRDKLQSIQQSAIETNRGISRNI